MEHGISEDQTKILAIKTHALGDVLMTTPAIRALRKAFPRSTIHYLTGRWSAPALENNPHIDRVISVDDAVFHNKRIDRLYTLIRHLRSHRYDTCILFQPSFMMRLFARLTAAGQIAGPVIEGNGCCVDVASNWRFDRNRYVVEDFLDVVRGLGVVSDDLRLEYRTSGETEHRVDEMLKSMGGPPSDFLLVCPGGGQNPRDNVRQKLWPLSNYRAVIEQAVSEGLPVIIAGGESDRAYLKPLSGQPGTWNMVGKTSLAEFAVMLSRARLLLTNDSAPMHVALAVDCPFVAIFGPTRREALLPLSGRFVAVEAEIPCAPCYDNEPFKGCERFECIRSITVDTVWSNVIRSWRQWPD